MSLFVIFIYFFFSYRHIFLIFFVLPNPIACSFDNEHIPADWISHILLQFKSIAAYEHMKQHAVIISRVSCFIFSLFCAVCRLPNAERSRTELWKCDYVCKRVAN